MLGKPVAQVSSINLQVGAIPVHYEIADQSGNPLAPSALQSLQIDGSLQAGLVFSTDATGFFFSWLASVPPAAGNITASFHLPGTGPPIRRSFPVVVGNASPITDLTLLQQ